MRDYTVLQSLKIDTLVNLVNTFIADGWRPLAGIQVSHGKRRRFYQSMIRETQNATDMVRRLQVSQRGEADGVAAWASDELVRAMESDDGEEN